MLYRRFEVRRSTHRKGANAAPQMGVQAMSKALRVITNPATQTAPVESSAYTGLSERIRRLQTEAEQLAREHICAFAASLAQTQRIAQEIAQGGEAYPAGVREIARQLAEESQAKAQTLAAILTRR
jgi:hypothetical protein